jgi:ribosomal protein L11 methyltransferase
LEEIALDWIQLAINTTSEGIEPLTGRLYNIGITGFEIEDEKDFLDFLENQTRNWDYVDESLLESKKGKTCVKVYLSDNQAGHDMLRLIKESVGALKAEDADGKYGSLNMEFSNVSEDDWANNWKKYFKPIEIGEKILIKPQWHELLYDTDRIVFEVNPGMAFGTGTHETTRMCIQQLEKYVYSGSSVLDLGCGSGILSIISLLLGAKKVTAADIDPNCEKIAYQNARLNKVDDKDFTVFSGNVLEDLQLKKMLGSGYDVVAANIVADVIIALAPDIKTYLKPEGVCILSGIIDFRENEVANALKSCGIEIVSRQQEGEWLCLIGKVLL